MKIGNIDLGERPVMLAPMEDVTDQSFRLICREQGADMVYTEFVSADALIRSIERSFQKMAIAPGEHPAAIQIYGRDVDSMVEAARIAAQAHPDFIDINWGCPVKKIAGKGSGAGMLRNIPLMLEITRAVVNAVDLPVTVKTRLGWDHNSKIIVGLAEQLVSRIGLFVERSQRVSHDLDALRADYDDMQKSIDGTRGITQKANELKRLGIKEDVKHPLPLMED